MADFPMVVLAVAAVATPVVLAYLVDCQVRAFQREAFGHLAKAARNLRLMSGAVLLYYFGVLGGSWYAGDLATMLEYPLAREGLAIYVRIGAAVLAYVLALNVAKELYLVTRPKPVEDVPARAE